MRNVVIHTFKAVTNSPNADPFISRLYPYSKYPILFKGDTQEEVEQKARDFVDDAVNRHEAEYIRRVERTKNMKKKKAS